MANIFDYIEFRGDIKFSERPLNAVDNIILSELAYVEMDDYVPGPEFKDSLTIRELAEMYRYPEENEKEKEVPSEYDLLRAAGASDRFGDVSVCKYLDIIDTDADIQLSAVTYILSPKVLYIAFRGTDNTIVGWREDCNFACLDHTEGQEKAAAYLDSVLTGFKGTAYVGGHSKGGNLATYASAFCSEKNRAKIISVYSNDGPGVNDDIKGSEGYKSIYDRIVFSLPESSLVGILLFNPEKRTLVKSTANGIAQHNLFSWEVKRDSLVEAEKQSDSSLFMTEALAKWLGEMDETEKKNFINTIFDSLESSGETTLDGIQDNKRETYNAIFKAYRSMEPDRQKALSDSIKSLVKITRDMLFSDITEKMNELWPNKEKETETE